MALSAAFSVNSSSAIQAHETTYGSTVNLALLSLTGVSRVEWTINGTSHESMVSPTITPAGSPSGATASFAMPSDPGDSEGRAVAVKCTVTNTASNESATHYAIIGVPNINGIVPATAGEENYRHPTMGWTPIINKCLSAPTVVLDVASDTTAASSGTAAYSFPLPTSGKKYLLKFLVAAKEQTDNIYYTHLAYVEAWHDGSAAQIIGTPSIVLNGAHNASGASATVEFSVAYTESTTNIVATLTNSTNNTADVNFHCTVESIWSANP